MQPPWMVVGPVHVVPDKDGGWAVTHAGWRRSHFRTQEEAVAAGRRVARDGQVDLTIWSRNGRIRSKDSYGNESPVKDKEH